jgi:hypothetical protein
MTGSPVKAREPVMGRADVLLRFLQKIQKDRPQDIEPYLKNLDADSEQRPLADQIVDRIIAGDKTLYKHYAEARREVGARNPYASPEEAPKDTSRERALGSFMSKWIDLETTLRRLSATTTSGERYKLWSDLVHSATLKPETMRDLDLIRRLRNQAVHGIEAPDAEQLLEAAKVVQKALAELGKGSENKTTRRKRSRKATSRPKKI